jgi:Flp pilus assembly protein TadD
MPEMGWTNEEVYLLADRGYALYKQGQYRGAVLLFEGLVTIDPNNSYCRTALVAVCLALGDARRAVSELSILLTRNPADHEARARRCEVFCSLRRWDEARQDLTILRRNGERHHVKRLTWRLQAAGMPVSDRL